METDPDRSIRNMIDIGINFAKGRFQKEFFEALQEMLQNEQSAYYDLVKNLVQYTSHKRLRTFGMNLGFQACTLGANTIRENEEKWNFNIPWAYYLTLGSAGLPGPYVEQIISQGKGLGTYVYLLAGTGEITEEHTALLKNHPDCAFVLLVSPAEILSDLPDFLEEIPNCLILLENSSNLLAEAADALREQGFLYGVYETFSAKTQEKLWNTGHLEQICEVKAPLYVLMPRQRFSFEENEALREWTAEIRGRQEYPFIVFDFISDVQTIDRIISNDSCAVAFDSDGCVYTDTGKWQGTSYNIREKSLFEILEKVTKKR